MNKKVATYVLLPIVIIIWGVVIAKTISIFLPNENKLVSNNITTVIDLKQEFKRDSFTIVAKYRDPFLGNVVSPVKKASKLSRKKRIPQRQVIQKNINWNFVDYGGVLLNNTSKQAIALMKIYNKSYLMKEGDINKELTVEKIFKDSVSVNYKGVSKTIKK